MLTFSIKDAIDILLVSLLLYYIYRLMKESRSGNIFIGIIVFIIVWIFVSRVFNMSLLGSLMDKAVNLGTIALVILFQEEIRAFFSSIGTHRSAGKLLHLFNHNEHKKTSRKDIMPIVMACMSMSKQRVGALIVFERYIGLGDIINSGEVINANISQRLIENIFFKNSPLHDGAMVISHKRINTARVAQRRHSTAVRAAPPGRIGNNTKERRAGNNRFRRNRRDFGSIQRQVPPQPFG